MMEMEGWPTIGNVRYSLCYSTTNYHSGGCSPKSLAPASRKILYLYKKEHYVDVLRIILSSNMCSSMFLSKYGCVRPIIGIARS